MTQIRAAEAREPATWGTVLLAALLTWVGTSACGWALIAIGSVLVEVLPLEPAQVSAILDTIDLVAVLVFALMMSGIVSWVPLIILMPIVKALANADHDEPLIGAGIGLVSGAAASFFLFGKDFPGNEMIILGILVGTIMGATNMALLRWLRNRTATNTPESPHK